MPRQKPNSCKFYPSGLHCNILVAGICGKRNSAIVPHARSVAVYFLLGPRQTEGSGRLAVQLGGKEKEEIHFKATKRAEGEVASDMGPSAPRTRLKGQQFGTAVPTGGRKGQATEGEDAASVSWEASLAMPATTSPRGGRILGRLPRLAQSPSPWVHWPSANLGAQRGTVPGGAAQSTGGKTTFYLPAVPSLVPSSLPFPWTPLSDVESLGPLRHMWSFGAGLIITGHWPTETGDLQIHELFSSTRSQEPRGQLPPLPPVGIKSNDL